MPFNPDGGRFVLGDGNIALRHSVYPGGGPTMDVTPEQIDRIKMALLRERSQMQPQVPRTRLMGAVLGYPNPYQESFPTAAPPPASLREALMQQHMQER